MNPILPLAVLGAGALLFLTKKSGASASPSTTGQNYPGAANALNGAAAAAQANPQPSPPPPPVPLPHPTPQPAPPPPPPSTAPAPPPSPQLTPAPVAPPISPSGGVSASQAVGGTTTLPTTVITTGTAAWDASTMSAPDLSANAIPATYAVTSQETMDVQTALNTWAQQSGYAGAEIPLTVDGDYGPATQQAAGSFQTWVNATQNPATALVVDGLAGANTDNFLLDFGSITAGGY